MQKAHVVAAVLVAFLFLAPILVHGKDPAYVVIQGAGLPYAVRVTDSEAMVAFARFFGAYELPRPAAGTVLTYRYVIFFDVESELAMNWRYFYHPGTEPHPGFTFRVRHVGVTIDGDLQTWLETTVTRPPDLDFLLATYATPGAAEAQYVVGDPPPDAPIPVDIRNFGAEPRSSPVILIVAVAAAGTMVGFVLWFRRRLRAR